MSRMITLAAAVVLVLHGLIHLMGTTVYMRLGTVEALPYKTALLGGRWEVGEGGMWIFGALWAAAALGFVLATVAWQAHWGEWQRLLLAVTLLSLVVTVLDWEKAFVGAVVNVGILALLWLAPRWEALTP
jgi:hypothetical protein